jgi:HAD superfamily hydrolase (TIGR01509 family)
MRKPKAVVFDLGKVLLDFDYSIAVKNIAVHCSLSPEELHKLLNQSTLLHCYETGLMTSNEFFKEVKGLSKFCRDFETFAPIFGNIFTPIPEMIDLNSQLRSRGVPTYIFSNTNELAVSHIRATYPFFAEFSAHIYSFEHRAMKPHPSIYEVVEKTAATVGPDILYVDDRLENIEEGIRRGWRTIHHQSPAQTISQVKDLLVK